MNGFKIGNRSIGENNRVFIVGELSCNHRQSFDIAIKSVDAIKESGADAIKLSTDKPGNITIECDNSYFQIKQGTIWDGKTLYNLYQETDTPWEWQEKIKNYAESIGLICFSTPSCEEGVDFLETLNVPCYKIASFEITDIPLIEKVAKTGKPIIISTGIATLTDIELAVKTCRKVSNEKIALLKCTSSYPAQLDEMNLNTIPNLRDTFNVQVGLSDHSVELIAPIVATTLGAKIIEKHFILDRSLGGPDASFSLNKTEFSEMVKAVRSTELVLGKIDYTLSPKIKKSREFSKSIFIVKNVEKGERITADNIKIIRPGFGMHPINYKDILGLTFNNSYEIGTPLLNKHINFK